MKQSNHSGFGFGTGLYIALFLGATALAVAGYQSLLPEKTQPVSAPVNVVVPDTEVSAAPEPPSAAPMLTQSAEPAAAPLLPEEEPTVTLPIEPTPELTPVPPQLIVAPLVGETVAAFSVDALSYSETLADWRTHDGIDIAAEPGTQVLAACSGTVLSVAEDDLLGMTVVLAHDGGYETTYANLQSVPNVAPQEYVSVGQVIGAVGRTSLAEYSEPTHLHFSVSRNGVSVDPNEFLKK